ncbi:MAG: T9SS type A sorting domain-containing protein [Chitinophagales bacterium]
MNGMRPGVTRYNLNNGTYGHRSYIKDINEEDVARLYAIDIIPSGLIQYGVGIYGDYNGQEADNDMFLMKINGNLGTVWQSRFWFGHASITLHAIESYPNGFHTPNELIAYGNRNSNPILANVASDGSSVNWCYEYTQLKAPVGPCNNSMIRIDEYIYAVGWYTDQVGGGSEEVGVLLKTHADEGTVDDCSTARTLQVSEVAIEINPALDEEDVDLEQIHPTPTPQGCTSSYTTPCFEEKLSAEDKNEAPVTLVNNISGEATIYIGNYDVNNNYGLKIYNMMGQMVLNAEDISVSHTFELQHGIYIYQLSINDQLEIADTFIIK